jgi:hypothetical protein
VETEADANDFIAMMKEKLEGRNLDDVQKMDQMTIPCLYHSNKMIDVKRSKTIHTRTSMMCTKYITLAATVTASRKMMTPFLIFK